MSGQPGRDLAGPEQVGHHLQGLPGRLGREVGLVGRADGADEAVRQRLVQAVAQHAELQGVEQLVDRLPVPRGRQQVAGHRADRLGGQVGDQRGELAVAQHVGQVLAQRVARLALDLVHPVDQRGQRAELR